MASREELIGLESCKKWRSGVLVRRCLREGGVRGMAARGQVSNKGVAEG